MRLGGFDVSRRYRVIFVKPGQTREVDGFTRKKEGITVRIEGALMLELLMFGERYVKHILRGGYSDEGGQ